MGRAVSLDSDTPLDGQRKCQGRGPLYTMEAK